MTMKVATRSSGTPPLIPPGGKHRSRKLGNSGKRVANATAVAAEAAAAADVGVTPTLEVSDRDDDGIAPELAGHDEEGIFIDLKKKIRIDHINTEKWESREQNGSFYLPVSGDPSACLPSCG